ncbi:MAG: hypothetical protein AAF609_13605 [Cyanobacteria bacterium P01_C01_bin.120]
MQATVTIEIPREQSDALLLIAQRITFDDCLRRTDGYDTHPETGNPEQAYAFINAIGVLREALEDLS